VEDEGNPVVGAMVDLDPVERADITDWMRFASQKYFNHLPDMAQTDEQGVFRIARVPEGVYNVALSHRDFYPDPANLPLCVAPGGATWVGTLRRGIVIEGLLLAPDGGTVPGAQVLLFKRDQDGKTVKGFSKVVETTEGGTFSLRGLSGGNYEAMFIPAAMYAARREEIDPAAPPGTPWRVTLEERRPDKSQGAQ